jgi:iron(III) transport system permease protein
VNAKQLTLLLTAVLIAGIALTPLLAMIAASVTIDGKISFFHYQTLLSSGRTWRLFGHSVALSFLTSLCASALGMPLGVLFGQTSLPFRRAFTFLFTIPLLVPPYIIAVAWSAILGREGWLAYLTGGITAETTSAWLFGLPGCVLVLTTAFTPVVMLLTIAYLYTVNPRLEEAGRLVARWPRVLRDITLPMIRPGLLLGTGLVFLLALGEFSVPMYLRYDVFPVETLTQFSAFYDFGAATAAALPLALITLIVLMAERSLLRAPMKPMSLTSSETGARLIRLGATRGVWFLGVGMVSVVLILLPLTVLFLQASPADYREALSRAGDSLLRSLLYAMVGATLLGGLGFFCGYLVNTQALRAWRAVDFLTLFLLVVPSPVIGIGLIGLWNHPATNWIYGTPAMILFGYLAQYTALTSRITAAALVQIPPSMEEAASLTGAGWFQRVCHIIAPLARPGLAAAWLVAYIFCLRDSGVAMVVYPPGQDTLPVRIFTLMANSPEGLVAALCLLLIAATLLPLGGLGLILKTWGRTL